MSFNKPLLCLFVDGMAFNRWRQPLVDAANSAGVATIETPAPEHFLDEGRSLVLSDDISWTLHIPVDRTYVFYDGVLPASPLGVVGFADRHEMFKASRNLVIGSHAAQQGAELHDFSSRAVEFPGLGRIETGGSESTSAVEHSPLGMYSRMPPPVGASANWPGELFSFKPEAFHDGDADMDLTGRPRILTHGPYFYLPRGRWRAEIRFTIDTENRSVPLQFDWGTDGAFATYQTRFSKSGHYQLVLENDWSQPAPAQVVIRLSEGLFQGRLAFLGCEVTKVGDVLEMSAACDESDS